MSSHGPPPRRRAPPSFTPRFTISLVYLVVFFFVFSALQVLPDLLDVLAQGPPGPAQQRAAEQVAREGVNVPMSTLLAVLAVCVGAYYEVLPGMRTR